MHLTLVNVSGRLSTDGSRLVSALLKRAGHQVDSVFLSRTEPLLYGRDELALLDPILRRTGAVLLSVYSSYAVRAVQVSDFVHERYPGAKVFWGGPHCISVPELGLRHADGICFSEGDEAVVALADAMARGVSWRDTPNFAFRDGHGLRMNPVLPPFRDLDGLPFYDYSYDGHFMLDRELLPMSREHLEKRLAGYPYRIPIFYYMTSRGCPHSCAYCNNCRYVALWGNSAIRLQSVQRALEELEHQLSRLDFIKCVIFGDDDFFVRPLDQLALFAEQYRKRIRLPFGVAVSARTYRRDKLEVLLDAGLTGIQMGVQSGSRRVIREVYERKISVTKVRETAAEIGTYSRRLDLILDFIIDNPYETRADILKSLRLILGLPWEVKINVFYLAYFPGTPLYDRALADGYIQPYSQQAYRPYTRSRLRFQRNWETFLILLLRLLRAAVKRPGRSLGVLIRLLASAPVRTLMAAVPAPFYSALSGLLQQVTRRAVKGSGLGKR
jgi:anaerobic magnesium-protoporphyrin IX monomethyl ester cyclase